MPIEDLISLTHSMIESFSSHPIPVIQLAEHLGEVTNDWAPGLPAVVRPQNPVFSEIQVIPKVDGSKAEQLWLRLVQPGDIRARDLRKAFGKQRKMPKWQPHGPVKLTFDIDPPDNPTHARWSLR